MGCSANVPSRTRDGERDMAENMVHLVLARVTGAPEGVKGISLLAVPKLLVGKHGSRGERNDVHRVSIEQAKGRRLPAFWREWRGCARAARYFETRLKVATTSPPSVAVRSAPP
jgi:hypothetical protein